MRSDLYGDKKMLKTPSKMSRLIYPRKPQININVDCSIGRLLWFQGYNERTFEAIADFINDNLVKIFKHQNPSNGGLCGTGKEAIDSPYSKNSQQYYQLTLGVEINRCQ